MRHTAGWQDTPLGRIEPLPADRQPVRDRADRERTTRDSAEQIRLAVERLRRNLPDENSERLFIESGYFDVAPTCEKARFPFFSLFHDSYPVHMAHILTYQSI